MAGIPSTGMVSRSMETVVPTYHGYVNGTFDALLLFEAYLTGYLKPVLRRPHDRERLVLIQSGNTFIFEEVASGIRRWTDGKIWSPARLQGNFVIYRELDEPSPPGEKKRALKKSTQSSEEFSSRPATSTRTVAQLPPVGTPVPSQQREATRKILIGPLVDSFHFKAGGLIKKTISVRVLSRTHHLVSYYSVDDIFKNQLLRPSQDPFFQAIMPRDELLLNQDFRSSFEEFNNADVAFGLPYHHRLIVARQQQVESEGMVQVNGSQYLFSCGPRLAVAETRPPYAHTKPEYDADLPAHLVNSASSQQMQLQLQSQVLEHHQQYSFSLLEQMATHHQTQGTPWACPPTPQSLFSDLSNVCTQIRVVDNYFDQNYRVSDGLQENNKHSLLGHAEHSESSAATTHWQFLSDRSSLPNDHCVSRYSPLLPESQTGASIYPTTYHQRSQYSNAADITSASRLGSYSMLDAPPPPHVRVIQIRPEPRCWEHGCNGQQFSTFSNLLRHQREKSGQATKVPCPNCGAEFTRKTARNKHLSDGCRRRRNY